MVGVTKWKYSQAAIDERQDMCDHYGDPSEKCKNEAWFIRELSQQLEEKFDVTRNLTFAFMDSYSQAYIRVWRMRCSSSTGWRRRGNCGQKPLGRTKLSTSRPSTRFWRRMLLVKRKFSDSPTSLMRRLPNSKRMFMPMKYLSMRTRLLLMNCRLKV